MPDMTNMQRLSLTAFFLTVTALTSAPRSGAAQTQSIALPDDDVPVTIEASVYWGNLIVRGHADLETVTLGVTYTAGNNTPERVEDWSGLVTVESADGLFRVVGRRPPNGSFESIDLTLDVPRHAPVSLHVEKGGEIVVSDLDDLVEVNHRNGSVDLRHLRGFAIVHAVNGEISASFDAVQPDRTMSFVTLNGGVELELPENVSTRVRLRTTRNGHIYSEFDLPGTSYPYASLPTDDEPTRKYSQEPVSIVSSIGGGTGWLVATTENGPIHVSKR